MDSMYSSLGLSGYVDSGKRDGLAASLNQVLHSYSLNVDLDLSILLVLSILLILSILLVLVLSILLLLLLIVRN